MVFAVGGCELEDVRLEGAQWPELKPSKSYYLHHMLNTHACMYAHACWFLPITAASVAKCAAFTGAGIVFTNSVQQNSMTTLCGSFSYSNSIDLDVTLANFVQQ